MEYCKGIRSQLYPGNADPTPHNMPSQIGRVVIIAGSTPDIRLALARICYDAGATVYMAARKKSRAHAAIKEIATTSISKAPGLIKFLQIDSSNLTTIKPFVTASLSQES